MTRPVLAWTVWLGLLGGCRADYLAPVDDGEWLPGGLTTNTTLLGSQSFLRPAKTLSDANEALFYSGNSFFNQPWVEAPASTQVRDGLGPLFNARTCSGCHFKDGRAAPPAEGPGPFVGLLFRLSVPTADGPVPHPVYGEQLQDQAIPNVPVEGIPVLDTELFDGTYPDGTPYTLQAPVYSLTQPKYGDFPDDLMVSPRIAPHMIGLGLLEAIPADDILDLADPDDTDGDGISGRPQWAVDPETGNTYLGRFGWKAETVGIRHQSAAAFAGDMGLTSTLAPIDDCTSLQTECLEQPSGGEFEVEPHILDRVAVYSQTIAPPARTVWDTRDIRRGKQLFSTIGCASCHTPSWTTGSLDGIPEFAGELIWPYTDLLLHDMGPELADGRPSLEANGQEWRTPPLWGLGKVPDVNGHTRYLHDGRARNFEEAVLWHGGEAARSRDDFMDLDATDRAKLIQFVESL